MTLTWSQSKKCPLAEPLPQTRTLCNHQMKSLLLPLNTDRTMSELIHRLSEHANICHFVRHKKYELRLIWINTVFNHFERPHCIYLKRLRVISDPCRERLTLTLLILWKRKRKASTDDINGSNLWSLRFSWLNFHDTRMSCLILVNSWAWQLSLKEQVEVSYPTSRLWTLRPEPNTYVS